MADIDRTDAAGLLQDQDINEILQSAEEFSAALRTFRTVRMGTKIARMPVLAALPTAGFVTETGTKPTSEVVWEKKELTAEEIAVIVPVHEDVFDDSAFNVWDEVRPLVAQELGRVLDAAVFFGTNAPASWPDSLVEGATAANNTYGEGDSTVDLAEDINQTWALVEADGYDVNVQYAARALRARLRGLRNADDTPIYLEALRGDGSTRSLMGEDITYVTNGAWDADEATLIAGDRSKAILGIRSDVQYKILTEATVGGGTIHLAERDMIAVRAKFRVAFQVGDIITPENQVDAYPFAVLTPAGS